jgi:hypothetical protein
MARDKITLPVSIDKSELAVALARELSYDALLSLFRDVDKIIADWGFTKKVHDHFNREMRILAEEEGRTLPKEPKPWTKAQITRAWWNSPELHNEVQALQFERLVTAIEKMQGIRPETEGTYLP